MSKKQWAGLIGIFVAATAIDFATFPLIHGQKTDASTKSHTQNYGQIEAENPAGPPVEMQPE